MLRITFERVARRLTIAQLAELANITSAHLSNVEQGFRQPSLAVLGDLASALSVDPPEALLRPVVIMEQVPQGAVQEHV